MNRPSNKSILLVFATIFICCISTIAMGADVTGNIDRGDDLFRKGHFSEAAKVYQAVLKSDAENYPATLRLGEIALFHNRFAEAEKYLTKAIKLNPDDATPKKELAEVYYRQDDFQRASSLLKEAGSEEVAKKLDSLKSVKPYEISSDVNKTYVKFVQTDPLPVVRMSVNGNEESLFLIDTGASEVYLDPVFAEKIGAKRFGTTEGTFAGGKKADVQHASIESIRLGDFTVKNIPVVLLSTEKFSGVTGGKPIDGIIGTVLFYHFVATLDYPNGNLVLRRKSQETRNELNKMIKSENTHSVPFWMAEKHFMVTWAQVNEAEPCLMFVDTGLAGGGLTCPDSTIKAAGISLEGLPSFQGMGGGGPVTVVPFIVKKLSMGDIHQTNITGMAGAFPPSAENVAGFKIGGIISHGFFRPYALTFDFEKMQLIVGSD